MASEVPYTGTPTVAPRLEPTPSVQVGADPAAFGVNVARAFENLGQVQEGAGKELFDRAFAMRELQAHANANAAISDIQNKQLQVGTQYRQLEGKSAIDAYPKFQSDLDSIREAGRQNLSPYEQMLYDSESRSSTFREKVLGAGYAATEQKRYIVGSSKAAVESAINSVEANPTDEATYKASLDKIRAEANHQADVGGLPADDPQRTLLVKTDVSRAIERRIYGLAETGRTKDAQELFNKATGTKDLVSTGIDAYGRTSTQRLQAYINERAQTIGARHGASEVLGGEYPKWTDGKLNDAGILAALRSSEGGSYTFRGPTVTDKAGNTGQALGHYGIMSYNLQGWLREAGMGPMTEDEFLHGPNAQSAQDQLALFKFRQYQDRFGSARLAAKAWLGGPGSVNVPDEQLHDKNMNFVTYLHNFNAGVVGNASLKDKVEMGRQWAKDQGLNDEATDAVVGHIERINAQEERIRRDTEFSNEQTIASALTTAGTNGKLPDSLELLRSDPKVAAALDELWPTKREGVQKQLLANARDPVPFTQERQNEYLKLVGMAGSDDQRQEFLSKDVLTLDLPFQQKNDLLKLQQRVQKQAEEAVPMARAMMLLGTKVKALGLDQDKDNLNLFKGTMTKVLEDFMNENKRPPKNKEIEDIGSQLLQQQATAGFFGTTIGAGVTSPWFEKQIENADQQLVEQIRQFYRSKGAEPSDFDINRSLIQLEYREQFGKTIGGTTGGPSTMWGAKPAEHSKMPPPTGQTAPGRVTGVSQ